MSRESIPRFRRTASRHGRDGKEWIRWVGVLGLLLFFSGGGPAGSAHGAWAGETAFEAPGQKPPLASVLATMAMPPSHVTRGERAQLTGRNGVERALLRCRGAFVVITHRAGWPLPKDEGRVRDLLAQIFLRLVPEWPDGLPAYPIARPAGHPASRLLRAHVFRRTAAELDHHWTVMSRRFGQEPPPVVGSARLLLRLVARQPGAVGILSADELPAPAFWPQEARIAAVLAPQSVRRICSQPLLEAVYSGAGETSTKVSSRSMARDERGGRFERDFRAKARAFAGDRTPRGTVVRHRTP